MESHKQFEVEEYFFVISFIGTSDKEWAACHNRIKPTIYGGPTYVENKKIEKFPMIFGGRLIICESPIYRDIVITH
jgi:hypothetical protein